MPGSSTDRLDGVNSWAAIKLPCIAASTSNVTLSGLQTIDGVVGEENDRVLLTGQTDQTQNGPWIMSTSAWTRPKDFDGQRDAVTGTIIYALEGTANSGFWSLTTAAPVNVGSDNLTWEKSASILSFYSAAITAFLGSATNAAALTSLGISAYIQTLLDDADAGTAQSTLGLTTYIKTLMDDADAATARATLGIDYGPWRQNYSVTATVAASALTVALKTKAGVDPSATDPLILSFRTLTAGTYSTITLTSAQSLVVSSGSTLGMVNGQRTNLYVVGFNDAGTFRLGIINPTLTDGIFPLGDDVQRSSLAEGGLGAADSAGVFYTTSGTSAPSSYVVLARLSTSEATAGTWATAPSQIALISPETHLPGAVVQVRRITDGNVATGTTATPFDTSIPQVAEGDQYLSQAITPTDSGNRLRARYEANAANSNASVYITASLFRSDVANDAISATSVRMEVGGIPVALIGQYDGLANTTSAVTFSVRVGATTGATTTFNGVAGAVRHGGVMSSYLQVEEIQT